MNQPLIFQGVDEKIVGSLFLTFVDSHPNDPLQARVNLFLGDFRMFVIPKTSASDTKKTTEKSTLPEEQKASET